MSNFSKSKAIVSVSLLWLSACAPSPCLPVAPAEIPPLPKAARQQPAPDWCSPTCSAALANDYEAALRRLTNPASPASSASGLTTR